MQWRLAGADMGSMTASVRPYYAAQAFGGALRGDVALRLAEQLEADHELTDRRRAQQRRIEVGVQVQFRMRLPVRRPLVHAHRVRELDAEEPVVAGGQA